MKRSFRSKGAPKTAYPTLGELPAQRRRLLLGLGAAALTTALPACYPFRTAGEADLPYFPADAGPDAAVPDAASVPTPDASAPDAGAPDGEILDGDPPMPDLPDGG